jgi:hypothetical protein
MLGYGLRLTQPTPLNLNKLSLSKCHLGKQFISELLAQLIGTRQLQFLDLYISPLQTGNPGIFGIWINMIG